MSFIEVSPLKKSVTAAIEIPGSKSYTNRALIMAALTKGSVTLWNPLYSEDTEAMIGSLRTLGLRIETKVNQITVYDDISIVQDKFYDLFVKDSGTSMRFLLALLCLVPGQKIIRGSVRLNERPIKDLVDTLHRLEGKIKYLETPNQPPLKITSSSLKRNAEVTLNASMSSQFLSALLMIAPTLDGLKIVLQGELISKPYIDMTIQMMRDWGVQVPQQKDEFYSIPEGQCYQRSDYVIEGDFSSAGYFFAIAALTESKITVKNLNPHTAQADVEFLTILSNMGNLVTFGKNEITIEGKQVLPQNLDMKNCPDQVQTMAVLAAFAKGVTRISGVRSLRLKETERVHALKMELGKMGIRVEDEEDSLTIYGGNPQPSLIETYGDHRMAMAFAVAGTKLSGIKIQNPEVVNKTFPDYWEKLKKL